MDQSRLVSDFVVNMKGTPSTYGQQRQTSPKQCLNCLEHLTTATNLRKQEILLQLNIEQLKEQVQQLKKENEALTQEKVLTYFEYQKKLEQQKSDNWNRQDIEVELFQAKTIIELLMLSKSNHPQIKTITDESLKEKYANLLLQNLRLEEKVEARDRIIAEKNYFPLYHYDQRITTLRKAVAFWYRKSEEQCAKMKNKVKQVRIRMQEESKMLRDEISSQLQNNKMKILKVLDNLKANQLSIASRKNQSKSTIQPNSANIMISRQSKKNTPSILKHTQIKKFR